MTLRISARRAGLPRRRLLWGGLAAMASAGLAACGGGGGGASPGPSPAPSPPPPGGVNGHLVYRNSGLVGLYGFARGSEISFSPGTEPFFDPGVAVSRDGLVTAALDGDNDGFDIAVFDLTGQPVTTYTVERPFAFQTSAAVFSADGTRIAFSLDEPRSTNDNTRISRTLVYELATGNELASLDGFAEPVWSGTGTELVARNAQSDALWQFDANHVDRGAVGGLVINSLVGGYNLSADGRTVVHSDGNRILAYQRSIGTSWVAAEDINSSTNSPCLSPDGQFLALLARDLLNAVPHVVPFAPGSTVRVDSATHAVGNTLADCAGRIGWTT